MGYIEDVHAENWKVIDQHKIVPGERWYCTMPRGHDMPYTVTIDHIHDLYGWIVTNTRAPQRAQEFVKKFSRIEP